MWIKVARVSLSRGGSSGIPTAGDDQSKPLSEIYGTKPISLCSKYKSISWWAPLPAQLSFRFQKRICHPVTKSCCWKSDWPIGIYKNKLQHWLYYETTLTIRQTFASLKTDAKNWATLVQWRMDRPLLAHRSFTPAKPGFELSCGYVQLFGNFGSFQVESSFGNNVTHSPVKLFEGTRLESTGFFDD